VCHNHQLLELLVSILLLRIAGSAILREADFSFRIQATQSGDKLHHDKQPSIVVTDFEDLAD
jgi:hypothetical protein